MMVYVGKDKMDMVVKEARWRAIVYAWLFGCVDRFGTNV